MGMTTFSGPVRSLAGFISGTGVDTLVPVTGQNVALSPADNGKTIQINFPGASGALTLPPATLDNVGLQYTVTFIATANPGGYKIRTTSVTPGDLIVGSIIMAPVAGGAALMFTGNGSSNDALNIGGATGGQIGSTLTFNCTAGSSPTAPNAGRWTVSGNLLASTVPTTPFADA